MLFMLWLVLSEGRGPQENPMCHLFGWILGEGKVGGRVLKLIKEICCCKHFFFLRRSHQLPPTPISQCTMAQAMEIEGSKAHKSKTQFYVQFWWKKALFFFKWCKTLNIFEWIFGLINFFKYLWSYLQKTWIAGLWNMKFCVRSNQTVLRKKGENKIFHSAAIHGANICQIFVYILHHWKIFGVFFTAIFNWSPKTYSHPSNYLLELQLILVDLLA